MSIGEIPVQSLILACNRNQRAVKSSRLWRFAAYTPRVKNALAFLT
ncbi:MAG: hypothetical protein LBC86_06760 [Oscillospiraceae bacterium]|nr:hypothetical protein [Oscillospiraceae bacterium]